MKNKKHTSGDNHIEISSKTVYGQPQNVFDLINKYGTYNIQPTAESDADFPKIAQGIPPANKRKIVDKD